jgi:hypothetical protein
MQSCQKRCKLGLALGPGIIKSRRCFNNRLASATSGTSSEDALWCGPYDMECLNGETR